MTTGNNKRMSYGEMLQQREKERGEEILKNDARMAMRQSTSWTQRNSSGVVEAKGNRPMSYAERLQAQERARGEEVLRNNSRVTMRSSSSSIQRSSGVVEGSGKRSMGYAEYLQAQERARGEEVIKNDSSVTMRSIQQQGVGGGGANPCYGSVVESQGKRTMGYAEWLQAQEAARGEAVLKNDSSITMRTSQQGFGGANNAHSAGGFVVESSGRRRSGYAEMLQAREAASGQEVIKNDSSITMRSSMQSSQNGGTTTGAHYGTVEASGRGNGGYAETLQAREAAMGEEVIKNDSSITMRSSSQQTHVVVSRGGSSGSGCGSMGGGDAAPMSSSDHSSEAAATPSGSAAEIDEDMQILEESRREELHDIMKDRSLSKSECAAAMEEVRERYAAMIKDLLG